MKKLAKLLNETGKATDGADPIEKVAEQYYVFGQIMAEGFKAGLMEKDAGKIGDFFQGGKNLARRAFEKLVYKKEVKNIGGIPMQQQTMRGFAKSVSKHPLRYGLGAAGAAGAAGGAYYYSKK